MTALSPGPWRVEDHEYHTAILDHDGKKIAEVYVPRPNSRTIGEPSFIERAQRIANAQAMAKAGESK